MLMVELMVYPGPMTALAYEGELTSRLMANYGADPVAAKIRQLRLTIVEDVLGGSEPGGDEASVISDLLEDPVPTATPKTNARPTKTKVGDPSKTPILPKTATAGPMGTALPAVTDTPLPASTNTPAAGSYCGNVSITSMWVSDDDVKARVQNSGPKDIYLTNTVFVWPDVPAPGHVDWFKFDGDEYYSSDDSSSPTAASGSWEKLGDGDTDTWKVDFDGAGGEIYGSFTVTLTFDVPAYGTCTVSRSTFEDLPATAVPTLAPSDTPLPPTLEPTATITPTATTVPSATPTYTLVPSATPTESPTPTKKPKGKPPASSTPTPSTPIP